MVIPAQTLNFCLYKPCAILLHFRPCAGSEPDCNCCLSNKYNYMQLRSPEVTRVNFHLTVCVCVCVVVCVCMCVCVCSAQSCITKAFSLIALSDSTLTPSTGFTGHML